jgi:hypothetical protein
LRKEWKLPIENQKELLSHTCMDNSITMLLPMYSKRTKLPKKEFSNSRLKVLLGITHASVPSQVSILEMRLVNPSMRTSKNTMYDFCSQDCSWPKKGRLARRLGTPSHCEKWPFSHTCLPDADPGSGRPLGFCRFEREFELWLGTSVLFLLRIGNASCESGIAA